MIRDPVSMGLADMTQITVVSSGVSRDTTPLSRYHNFKHTIKQGIQNESHLS